MTKSIGTSLDRRAPKRARRTLDDTVADRVAPRRRAAAGDDDSLLPGVLRRVAVVYVAVLLPIAALVGLVVRGERAFLLSWVIVSALFTTPAGILSWEVARRVRFQVTAWWLWFFGVMAIWMNGVCLLLLLAFPSVVPEHLGFLAVLPCVLLFGAAGVSMMRARSGLRAVSLDVLEASIAIGVVLAVAAFALGDRIADADAAWFAVSSAVAAVSVTTGLFWQVTLRRRVSPGSRRLETIGLALAAVGAIDSWVMVAQGISGFTLPVAPLLVLQAMAMSLLMLVPLYVPRAAPEGLDRFPPHAQVRDGWQVLAFIALGIPALVVVVAIRHQAEPRLVPALIGVLLVILALTTVRQLLVASETRRLYELVSVAADERRRLLAEVMISLDEDRHRVASQLHDQAISAYTAFASLAQSASAGSGRSAMLAGASGQLRDDLAEQAEALRRLMLAVRPLEARGWTAQRLTTPIAAYVSSLWNDGSAPSLRVEVDADLRLDWTTETLALRIVQEAIGNVWRHAAATSIEVRFAVEDSHVTIEVSDDGVGFASDQPPGDSGGIASMRSFAALADGELVVSSRPQQGTSVLARLGTALASGAAPPASADRRGGSPDPSARPRLRLVP